MASTTCARRRPPLRGDETDLFRRHHRRLLALVARDVPSRPQVIEDACAYAWLELVARQPDRTNIMGWLRIVARREAIRLGVYDRRLAGESAERVDERGAERRSAGEDAREALGHLAALPARKRAVLTLRLSGYSHAEIAGELRMTRRTVERQLVRARAAVRCANEAVGAA
jgi:RNA polymerase sigma factor (sigma-70 family)